MINYKSRKKIIIIILAIIIMIAILLLAYLCTNKTEDEPIVTYTLNQADQMRNEEEIFDEVFDKYGNLIHYKYNKKLEDGSIVEKEYNINYTFDSMNRITKVEYDNNYIEIEYNDENKISKLINQIQYEDESIRKITYDFTYENLITKVNSIKDYISNNEEENYTNFEVYTLEETIINDEKYSICTIIDEKNYINDEYLYKIQDKEIDYRNIFSLLSVEFEGYVCLESKYKNIDFTIEMPIFNSGNMIYTKNLSIYIKRSLLDSYYYDKNDNILKYYMNTIENNSIYYKYKYINDKEYYGYCLESMGSYYYTYVKYKDYLTEDNKIYKREIVENEIISEEEYKKKLEDFEKYFEKNKQNENLYN